MGSSGFGFDGVCCHSGGFPGSSVVKDPPANSGDVRDVGSIPGSGRSPGGGHGHPLQYSCLENAMDRGAWWATVYGVAESQARLKLLSMNPHMNTHLGQFWSPL